MSYRPIKYKIHGVVLYAVENNEGGIFKYCDTEDDAIDYCYQLNYEISPPMELKKALIYGQGNGGDA